MLVYIKKHSTSSCFNHTHPLASCTTECILQVQLQVPWIHVYVLHDQILKY